MTEADDIERAVHILTKALPTSYEAKSKENLLYQVTLDQKLRPTADFRAPKRGRSAFQTDLCVFRKDKDGVMVPKVALEFKNGVSTHDVITYSNKAMRHKQVYPYLRYGMLAYGEETVPGRFFLHNQGLDFFWPLWGRESDLPAILPRIVLSELGMSDLLERAIFRGEKFSSFTIALQVTEA